MEALPQLGVLLVLVAGSVRISGGDLEAGELVQIAYLFTLLAFPVRAIGWLLGDLPRAVIGYERVRGVIDAEGGTVYGDAGVEKDGPAQLEARALRFGYADGQDILTDVTFDVGARPLLIEGGVKMHTLLVFFSIVGGIAYFGILGMFFGPLIFAIDMTLLEFFILPRAVAAKQTSLEQT